MSSQVVVPLATPVEGRFVSQYSSEYWRTHKGEVYQLAFMQTSHMFYTFRMLYDMIAEKHGWPVMRPAGSGLQANRQLDDETVATKMAWFATDIFVRNDLAPELRQQFVDMLARLLSHRPSQLAYVRALLEAPDAQD